jgi:hypothetical protein
MDIEDFLDRLQAPAAGLGREPNVVLCGDIAYSAVR